MNKMDKLIMDAAKHFRVTPKGELSRDSTPYKMTALAKMGVGFDGVGGGGYKQFLYSKERGGRRQMIMSHRMIYYIHHGELPEMLDHVDGDKLNNLIENLRPATKRQNGQNRKSAIGSSSEYLGVYWKKDVRKWVASINIDGKIKYLGCFHDEEDAALVYNLAAIEHHGEFANLNKIT
mgnify:CR=1 FL=1